jgi:hyperosmotically inducible periplasmic protein
MKKTMRSLRGAFFAAMLAGVLLALPRTSWAAARDSSTVAQSQQANAEAQLNKKQFQNVKADVQNGIATLTGSVDLYQYKVDAGKRVLHAHGVTAVRNDIAVAGPDLSDEQLEQKLAKELAYNREGYGSVFDAITLKVENGVAILGGHTHDYPNRDAALALVATTPGVKDVVDQIEVDPVSSMDWGIRMAVARSIYGYPTMTKYAIDPIRPIRISVQNGHVELYGTVDSEADKNIAYLRANQVPGVFSVKNFIQVAGQPQPKESAEK